MKLIGTREQPDPSMPVDCEWIAGRSLQVVTNNLKVKEADKSKACQLFIEVKCVRGDCGKKKDRNNAVIWIKRP